MKKNGKRRLLLGAGTALFLGAALLQPDKVLAGAARGLLLWYAKVLPVQFPFITGARLLLKLGLETWAQGRMNGLMNRLFGLPGRAGAVWLAGLVAGYPSGAFFTARLYEEGGLREYEILPLVLLSNTAGPLFVVGTLGEAMLGHAGWGAALLGIHWIGALATARLFCPRRGGGPVIWPAPIKPGADTDLGRLLSESAGEAAEVTVKAGEFIVLFSVLTELLPLPGRPELAGVASGLLEITGGAALLTARQPVSAGAFAALSFLLGFSGLSILMQTASVIKPAPCPLGKLTAGKLIQAAISGILAVPVFFAVL